MTMLNATLEGGLRYRGREGQWAYVFNRVSGLATLLFLTLHILDTATVYFIPQGYETFVDIYRSTPVMISEIMLVAAVLYLGLTARVEVHTAGGAVPPVSPAAKRIVYKLSALFTLDSIGGGFLANTLLAYWFFRRFGVGEEWLGPLFFAAGLANAGSHLGAAPLIAR